MLGSGTLSSSPLCAQPGVSAASVNVWTLAALPVGQWTRTQFTTGAYVQTAQLTTPLGQ